MVHPLHAHLEELASQYDRRRSTVFDVQIVVEQSNVTVSGAVLERAQHTAVIDLVKRSDAEGTWQANHFSWRIRSVIWAGVLYVVTAPLWLLLIAPGWIAWGLISLWFLYRIVRGMLAMSRNQAVDA